MKNKGKARFSKEEHVSYQHCTEAALCALSPPQQPLLCIWKHSHYN